MTWRGPAARRAQKSSSHQSIDAPAPMTSRTAGSVGVPKVWMQSPAPLAWTIVGFIVSRVAPLGPEASPLVARRRLWDGGAMCIHAHRETALFAAGDAD